jgi:hypothetical protein
LPNTLRMLVLPSTRDVAFSGSARMLGIRDYLRGRYGPPPQNSK